MILVTGATGNVGREVVDQLLAAGHDVRALTRDPGTARLPGGVEVAAGDLTLPETLPAALDGATAVFLFPVPGSAPAFLKAAKDAGVRRVVLLSSMAVDDDAEVQSNPIAAFHAVIEDAVAGSGLEWTFLRPGAFAANSYQWAEQAKAGDVVRVPFPGAVTAPIDEADIAAVGVRALTEDGHNGAKYALTGPEQLTQTDQVRIMGEVLGRPLRVEELPAEVARERMIKHTPAEIVDTFLDMFAKLVGGEALVTGTVQQVTGRPARTYAEWAQTHANAFR
ncbi:NAD(P)H-binding protein [Sphaerisporangium sp. NPDC051011]|uniref:NAD(P)H-binding protein n=1 Tax=Sphaerisporangium sp. NPDC051011 TaxID=3155792 RepID=UPI003406D201